jgi:NAD(P)-dependent dehydrogenase (short-subunit alcohol dehydrogenase family)
MRLEDRTVVITGGASGIGRGTAIEMAKEGADVVVGDVRETPLGADEDETTAEVVRDLGRDAVYCECDVSKEADVQALIETAGEEFGGIDILVNNAAINLRGSVEELSLEDWNTMIGVLLTGPFMGSKFAVPYLRESDQPRIINISSQVAFVAWPGNAAYDTLKGALSHFTRQMAVDLAEYDIRVNAICPGPIRTKNAKEEHRDYEISHRYDEKTLTSFTGEPQDIGRAAVFLASEDARYITGHNLLVDGGWLAGDFYS